MTLVMALAAVLAMQTPAPLAFETAMVKASDPNAPPGGGIRPLPGGQTYVATNVPLRLMIKLMYDITDSQIVGGPDWMNTDRFDVRAKAEKASTRDELHQMFQTLLADRFALKFHKESKVLPTYTLTVDKPGKMTVNESENRFEIPIIPSARGRAKGTRVPMSYLAWYLSQVLNRVVVDKTGLDKNYDFMLEFTPDGAPPPEAGAPEPAPSIFTALREQLGLKLESSKGPVEVFIIDRAEKPKEN